MSLEQIHRRTLKWYDSEKRALPWRESRDPYRIWISEIMLQQTRVEAVIPFYNRFISNFPTVASLAEADLDKVLNLWAGLGYYSRARNLHAAANQIVNEFRGIFPREFDALKSLKGIGPYTAAAVASMAFDQLHCSIDGNLERVFSRILALRSDPKSDGRPIISKFGQELVNFGRPGDLNQAFMDLASRICLARDPQCEICPIASNCASKRLGIQKELPLKKVKPAKVLLKARAWAVFSGSELLLVRRTPGEWLAGMWDLPWKIIESKDVRPCAPFGEVLATFSSPRTITKHRIEFEVNGIRCKKRPLAGELRHLCGATAELRWVPITELHGINLPRPSEKALEKILPKIN